MGYPCRSLIIESVVAIMVWPKRFTWLFFFALFDHIFQKKGYFLVWILTAPAEAHKNRKPAVNTNFANIFYVPLFFLHLNITMLLTIIVYVRRTITIIIIIMLRKCTVWCILCMCTWEKGRITEISIGVLTQKHKCATTIHIHQFSSDSQPHIEKSYRIGLIIKWFKHAVCWCERISLFSYFCLFVSSFTPDQQQ